MSEPDPNNSLYRSILDAMPMPVFVVDDDVRIIDMNRAATTCFGLNMFTAFRKRGGEAMHCLHSADSPKGCGHGPFCKSCVLRNSVNVSLKGNSVIRMRTSVELREGDLVRQFELLVTASPLPGPVERLSLLILEDISELVKLHDLIPMCASCKNIRNDEEFWVSVESYFTDHTGADFSHGICPECRAKLYPDLPVKDVAATEYA